MFQWFHSPPNSDQDYRIFNMRTDVNACDCLRRCTDTIRECALKVDSWRKIPCCTRKLNLRWRRAGPMLYQRSYISIPPNCINAASSFICLFICCRRPFLTLIDTSYSPFHLTTWRRSAINTFFFMFTWTQNLPRMWACHVCLWRITEGAEDCWWVWTPEKLTQFSTDQFG